MDTASINVWAILLAVVGPGLLAGLSDDDPAGITTYSILGAEHGYQLLWVLTVSTAALVVFHELGARMGIVTGQGLLGLIRERAGERVPARVRIELEVLEAARERVLAQAAADDDLVATRLDAVLVHVAQARRGLGDDRGVVALAGSVNDAERQPGRLERSAQERPGKTRLSLPLAPR